MTSRYHVDISDAAKAFGLDPLLLEAQVEIESGGMPWAWNPEPRYRYFWDVVKRAPFRAVTEAEVASKVPPADFPTLAGDRDSEWWGQQASWGLCQIMGAVARERGFARPYLTELCRPDLNLLLAAGILRDLHLWALGNPRQMLAAYNAGRGNWQSVAGLAYADKILALRDSWRP